MLYSRETIIGEQILIRGTASMSSTECTVKAVQLEGYADHNSIVLGVLNASQVKKCFVGYEESKNVSISMKVAYSEGKKDGRIAEQSLKIASRDFGEVEVNLSAPSSGLLQHSMQRPRISTIFAKGIRFENIQYDSTMTNVSCNATINMGGVSEQPLRLSITGEIGKGEYTTIKSVDWKLPIADGIPVSSMKGTLKKIGDGVDVGLNGILDFGKDVAITGTLFASLKGSHSDAKWDISSELNLNGKIIKVTDVGNELKLNVSSAAIYPSFTNALFNKFSFAKRKLKLTVMKDEESGGFWAAISGATALDKKSTQGSAIVRIVKCAKKWELITTINLPDNEHYTFESLSGVTNLGQLKKFAGVSTTAVLAFNPSGAKCAANTEALQAGTTMFLKYNVESVKQNIAGLEMFDFDKKALTFRAHFSKSSLLSLKAELGSIQIGNKLMVHLSATLQLQQPQIIIESSVDIKIPHHDHPLRANGMITFEYGRKQFQISR